MKMIAMNKMKKYVVILSILLLMQTVFSERILEMEMKVYKNDSVSLNKLRMIEGRPTFYIAPGDYRLEILDEGGEKIFEERYMLRFMIFTNPPTAVNSSILYLKPEYNSEMRTIKLYHDEREIFSQEINLCNDDGVCNEHETFLSCPGDCPLDERDGICIKDSDRTCDPDCAEGADPDCELGTTTARATTLPTTLLTTIPTTTIESEKKQDLLGYLPYLLGAIALIAIIFFIYKAIQRSRKGQRSKEEEQKLRIWAEEQLKNGEDPELLRKALEEQNSDPAIVDELMGKL